MTTTTTERPAASPLYDPSKPALDVLPERSGHRLAITWHAVTDDYSPQSGFLTVDAPEGGATYTVSEAPATFGRSFYLSKLSTTAPPRKGPNRDAEGYVVECGPATDGRGDRCECRSWQVRGWCRHCDAVRTLILNHWI